VLVVTEFYTFKDVSVECTITDDGKLYLTLLDGMDEGLLTVTGKVLHGSIPFPSIKLYYQQEVIT
jgi:hypothetical protein